MFPELKRVEATNKKIEEKNFFSLNVINYDGNWKNKNQSLVPYQRSRKDFCPPETDEKFIGDF